MDKIFSFFVKILLSYSKFSVEKMDSPQYHTLRSKGKRSNIPRNIPITHQIRKYFNPVAGGQWPRLVQMMKKLEVEKLVGLSLQ